MRRPFLVAAVLVIGAGNAWAKGSGAYSAGYAIGRVLGLVLMVAVSLLLTLKLLRYGKKDDKGKK